MQQTEQNEQITNPQFFVLLTFMMIGTTFLTMPTSLATRVMQDGWWIPIVSSVLAFPFLYMIILFGRYFPNLSLPEILVYLFGKWVGKALLLLVLLLPFYNSAGHTFFFTSFMNTHFFRNTPEDIIVVALVFVLIFGACLGIEVLGRAAVISFVPFILFLIVLTGFSAGDVDTRFISPMLDQQPMQYLDAIFLFTSKIIVTKLVLMLFFYPKTIEKKAKAEKYVYIAYFFSCFVLFLTTFMAITILGPDLTKVKIFTGFSIGQRVAIGDIIERLESLLVFMFFLCFYFMNALYLYILSVGTAFIFNVKNIKPIVVSLGTLHMYFARTEFNNLIEDTAYYFYGSFFFIIPACYVLPFVMFTLTLMKRRKEGLSLYPKRTEQKKETESASYENHS
ncbi:GerAB/ArcD/ProY family transporter [Geomicrobium sediminis]|uniref:Spore germination protein KB n=1 Tax=Geomicrobium sediminis TaxID=1347788 RepID=A0ABS2P9C0_9BACL|nr:endospore germination permease [Geomicrobium sediminis]MBM7631999.1 spore germination protein KB [Geomicrobium sediminis]